VLILAEPYHEGNDPRRLPIGYDRDPSSTIEADKGQVPTTLMISKLHINFSVPEMQSRQFCASQDVYAAGRGGS
jgi:hypothetical protein